MPVNRPLRRSSSSPIFICIGFLALRSTIASRSVSLGVSRSFAVFASVVTAQDVCDCERKRVCLCARAAFHYRLFRPTDYEAIAL